jgi:hypothetical protein
MVDLPTWATVGAEVQATGAERPAGPILIIVRITATQIILSDGSKWRTKDLTQFGTPAYNAECSYGVSRCRRLDSRAHVDALVLRRHAMDLSTAARQFMEGCATSDALRAAVLRIAPHIGLTATDMRGDQKG